MQCLNDLIVFALNDDIKQSNMQKNVYSIFELTTVDIIIKIYLL